MQNKKLFLGIELGSTRIKSVLTDENTKEIASGSYQWENKLVDGIWSYDLKDILAGIKGSFHDLKENYFKTYGKKLTHVDAIGISAMMHGYIALDENDHFLVPFRTWRNTITSVAADELSELFSFNIPERWSVAHYYQAVLNKEEHVKSVNRLTTLAGYIHYLLTGKFVLGIDDASGMFPILDHEFNREYLNKFDALLASKGIKGSFSDKLPKILLAGEDAGVLTEAGALLLDEEGDLEAGILCCPPEGDAATGMVATNSVLPHTSNVSAGTSAFLMVVLEKNLKKYYKEIDMVTTPDGFPVAMVHVNNFTNEINQWVSLFKEVEELTGGNVSQGELYDLLFKESQKSDDTTGSMTGYNFLSGEPVAKVEEGKLLLMRKPEGKLSLSNFMAAQIYSALSSLAIGTEFLYNEGVTIDSICGHGGFFKTDSVGAAAMSAALKAPVVIRKTASEGGAWGIAILASYAYERKNKNISLPDYLDSLFKDAEVKSYTASPLDIAKFEGFLEEYKKNLPILQKKESKYASLKERVWKENLNLVKNGLVVLTWGNASAIDRKSGVIVIKPSGVSYDTMKPDDMVVCNLDGNVIEGKYRPSSDTPTHVELYKAFPEINGVVHTHSTFATSFAQAGREIPCYGTTHADAFYGTVPVTRELREEEINSSYEKNTGLVIKETFQDKDYQAVPAVLVKNHGVFTWGNSVEHAVETAVTLEETAKMAYITESLRPNVKEASQVLQDKHYYRKHGKNAYYGQIKKD